MNFRIFVLFYQKITGRHDNISGMDIEHVLENVPKIIKNMKNTEYIATILFYNIKYLSINLTKGFKFESS